MLSLHFFVPFEIIGWNDDPFLHRWRYRLVQIVRPRMNVSKFKVGMYKEQRKARLIVMTLSKILCQNCCSTTFVHSTPRDSRWMAQSLFAILVSRTCRPIKLHINVVAWRPQVDIHKKKKRRRESLFSISLLDLWRLPFHSRVNYHGDYVVGSELCSDLVEIVS